MIINHILKNFFLATIIYFLTSCYYIDSNINTYGSYTFEDMEHEYVIYTEYLLFDYVPFFSIEEVSNSSSHIVRGEVLEYRVGEVDISLPIEFVPPEFLDFLSDDSVKE